MNRRNFISNAFLLSFGAVANAKIPLMKPKDKLQVRLLRHATVVLRLGDTQILVDPMLSPKGTLPPIQNTANQLPNPLVELPVDKKELQQIIATSDVVMLTHLHRDHWDDAAQEAIPKDKLIVCQKEDVTTLQSQGFANLISTDGEVSGMEVTRVKAQHGHDEIAVKMAPVTGYIVKTNDRVIYVAGDTVWFEGVAETIEKHQPDVIIVNGGAAQFTFGKPITMNTDDILETGKASKPKALVVVVHMEAINHCLLKRAELDSELNKTKYYEKFFIPGDGDNIDLTRWLT
jgi:L-ascorbate metabolism protein UlaG (beta-lactamase superfamily)